MTIRRTIQGAGFGLPLLFVWTLTAADPATLYKEGLRLFAAGDSNAAIAAFQESIRLRPSDAPAWMALGVVYAAGADYQRSEEPFHRACLLNSRLPNACLYYGRALYLLDRFEQAIKVLRTALESDPRNAQLYRIEALALEGSGKSDAAAAAFLEAIRLNSPSAPNEDPAIDYAVFLYREGRATEALAPLEKALERHPDAGRAHLELGCVLLALDRVQEAAAQLERATALDPQTPRGHLLLGKAYQRLGKDGLARKELDQGSRTVK